MCNGGYSKSIDMWSVGAVTSLLVSGANPCDPRGESQESQPDDDRMLATARNVVMNLPPLFETSPWRKVPGHTKSFISQLLVEEDCRMTVKEAMTHRWISGNDCGTYLEEIYNRAIADWSPRPRDIELTESLDARLLQRDASSGGTVSCESTPEYRREVGPRYSGSSSSRQTDACDIAADVAQPAAAPSTPPQKICEYRIVHTEGSMKYGYPKTKRAAPSPLRIGDGFDGVDLTAKSKKLKFATICR
jgi:serine/threonine protein kinase